MHVIYMASSDVAAVICGLSECSSCYLSVLQWAMALLGYFKPTSPNPYSTLSAENLSPMIWQENLAFCWRRRKILASSKTQTTYCGLCNYKSTSPRSGMDHESCSPSGLCQSYTLHLRFPIATCGGHIIFMHALRVRAHTAAGGYYCCFVLLHGENLKVSRPRSILHAWICTLFPRTSMGHIWLLPCMLHTSCTETRCYYNNNNRIT